MGTILGIAPGCRRGRALLRLGFRAGSPGGRPACDDRFPVGVAGPPGRAARRRPARIGAAGSLDRAARGTLRGSGRCVCCSWGLLPGGGRALEAGAAAHDAWVHRYPELPTRFPDDDAGHTDIYILVIGESSALGQPYDDWISPGDMVAWKLATVFPGRRDRGNLGQERLEPGADAPEACQAAPAAGCDLRLCRP